LDAHRDVASHLSKRSSEDQAYDVSVCRGYKLFFHAHILFPQSARELTAAMLGQELAAALKQIHGSIDNPDEDEDLNIKDKSITLTFGQRLKTALREVWKDSASDVFDIGYAIFDLYTGRFSDSVIPRSQEEVLRVDGLSEELGTIQSLRNSFNPILGMILMALDAPAIFMRTKALRALGQIVTSDSTILSTVSLFFG
jgi:cohesin loading factor subunit SCC2